MRPCDGCLLTARKWFMHWFSRAEHSKQREQARFYSFGPVGCRLTWVSRSAEFSFSYRKQKSKITVDSHISILPIIIIIIIIIIISCHRFFSSLVPLLLSQWWTPPLRLQVSACSTFLMMCDVPSMTVFVGNLLSVVLVIIIIIIIIIISCHRFSFFRGTSPLEPVVNPTTQASSLSLQHFPYDVWCS
jgi:hypothetical protein